MTMIIYIKIYGGRGRHMVCYFSTKIVRIIQPQWQFKLINLFLKSNLKKSIAWYSNSYRFRVAGGESYIYRCMKERETIGTSPKIISGFMTG